MSPAWRRYLEWREREVIRQLVLDEQRAALAAVAAEREARDEPTTLPASVFE